MSPNDENNSEDLNSEAAKAIIGAVYPALLDEPTSVRSRAQTAYTVASAIATALVAAGILGGIGDFGWYVQVLGVSAVGVWMVTAALYIDISRRIIKIPRAQPGQLLTMEEFVSTSLGLATDEADALEKKLTTAARWTYFALTLTGATLLIALVFPPADPAQPTSTLTLSSAGAAALAEQCPDIDGVLTGKLVTESLTEDFVAVVVENDCGDGKMTVRIRSRYVLAVGSASDN